MSEYLCALWPSGTPRPLSSCSSVAKGNSKSVNYKKHLYKGSKSYCGDKEA